MMEAWRHGAQILKWYFSAVCHGCVPLNMDLDNFQGGAAGFDPQARQFLIRIKRHLRSRGPPEAPLTWISELILST